MSSPIRLPPGFTSSWNTRRKNMAKVSNGFELEPSEATENIKRQELLKKRYANTMHKYEDDMNKEMNRNHPLFTLLPAELKNRLIKNNSNVYGHSVMRNTLKENPRNLPKNVKSLLNKWKREDPAGYNEWYSFPSVNYNNYFNENLRRYNNEQHAKEVQLHADREWDEGVSGMGAVGLQRTVNKPFQSAIFGSSKPRRATRKQRRGGNRTMRRNRK